VPAPSILEALRADLSDLERCAAAREPLGPERATLLYPLLSDVREALGGSHARASRG
jgi:hypothetical protein